jgi:hypothetical protein
VTEIVLDRIPFSVDAVHLARQARVEAGSGFDADLERLAGEAGEVARPKVLYRLAYPELTGEDRVAIDGVELRSRVLRVNLQEAHRVFLYVASCGTELETWARAKEDPLEQYCAEAAKALALGAAAQAFVQDLAERFESGSTAVMSPGSLADWPLPQQRPLFALLGDVRAKIGVELSPSCLMIPNKSISGLRFPTEARYENCMLCPRPDCPNRRARYDAGLYERKYGATTAAS